MNDKKKERVYIAMILIVGSIVVTVLAIFAYKLFIMELTKMVYKILVKLFGVFIVFVILDVLYIIYVLIREIVDEYNAHRKDRK